MPLRISLFLSLVLTAVALVPAGAHLAALPNKLGLGEADYFTVQAIYSGWALFGIVQVGAILATAVLAWLSRGSGLPFVLSLAALVLVVATLVLFFIFVFPANQATANWTTVPDNWQQLRTQWEYVHALNAVLTFFAFLALVLVAMNHGRAG